MHKLMNLVPNLDVLDDSELCSNVYLRHTR